MTEIRKLSNDKERYNQKIKQAILKEIPERLNFINEERFEESIL